MSLTSEPPLPTSERSTADSSGGEDLSVEPSTPALSGQEDLLGLRVGAALIDLALLFGLLVILSVTIGETSVEDGFSFYLSNADAALYLGLVLIYYFALEAAFGRTVGKLLLSVRVVGPAGSRPSVAAVGIRTLLRIVDWLPLLYVVGFITMLATGARRQRLGDLAARTGIARTVPLRHRGVAATAVVSALVVILAGSVVYVAASDEDEGVKTYRGHGVSFDYPVRWGLGSSEDVGSVGGTNKLWSTTVGPAEGAVDQVAVTAYRLSFTVTPQDMDEVTPELVSLVRHIADQVGGAVQGSPEELTLAGLPGVRFRIAGTVEGIAVQASLIFAFEGTTEYLVNCQYAPTRAEEIERGCEQILRTFAID